MWIYREKSFSLFVLASREKEEPGCFYENFVENFANGEKF
jgi:hypothetical protein